MALRRENTPARRETIAVIKKVVYNKLLWAGIGKNEEAAIPQETAIQLMSAGSLVQTGNPGKIP